LKIDEWRNMDIWEWVIVTIVAIFGLLGLPYPYGNIGKKAKKGKTWARPILSAIYYRVYIKGSLAEHFFYFVEEFENLIISNYTPSFPHMYWELIGKSTFTEMEKESILTFINEVQASYLKIKNVQNLKRKKVFEQTVREFKELVVEISRMARNINKMVKDRSIKLEQEYIDRYKFSAREFNNFLRYFRSFLDRTHCYHGVEIEHYRLLDLLIPEELFQVKEKVEKL
jgi:hypothetical protein